MQRTFDALRARVLGRAITVPDGLIYGGCGSDTVNSGETPAEHRIELKAGDGRVVLKMTAFAYCGFRYEGPAASSRRETRRIILDAANARWRQTKAREAKAWARRKSAVTLPKKPRRTNRKNLRALCTRQDSNLHGLPRRNLNPVRLPIPPLVRTRRSISPAWGVSQPLVPCAPASPAARPRSRRVPAWAFRSRAVSSSAASRGPSRRRGRGRCARSDPSCRCRSSRARGTCRG